TSRRAALACAAVLGVGAVAFGVLAPPERCPPVHAHDLRRAARETVGWFVRNQRADGSWLYLYDARSRTATDDYNIVRHSGAVSCGASGSSSPTRRSRLARSSPATTSRPDAPSPTSTRSSIPARPTGRWLVSTACSPKVPGARCPTASAPTCRPGATPPSTTG